MTQEYLKAILDYNKDTGLFVWKQKLAVRIKVGDVAGHISSTGYMVISVNGKRYKAHRLAFLYMTGSMPSKHIDHINHVRDDNRWSNIREVTIKENSRNVSKSSKNTSGQVGVYWDKSKNKWEASICVDGKKIFLGAFVEFHEALNNRKNAEALYGFHENHGKDK